MTPSDQGGRHDRTYDVPTGAGLARVHVAEPAGAVRATVALGHGAGGGVDSLDLLALARALPVQGFRVLRVEQPWRVAGRRVAASPLRLDAAWRDVVTWWLTTKVAAEGARSPRSGELLVVGGRSAGARVACRTAGVLGAVGVLALAFPLHPPGRPERSRIHELADVRVPVCVLQGERDPFGTPAEVAAELAALPAQAGHALPAQTGQALAAQAGHALAAQPGHVRVVSLPGADHGMRVRDSGPVTAGEVGELAARRSLDWLHDVVARREDSAPG